MTLTKCFYVSAALGCALLAAGTIGAQTRLPRDTSQATATTSGGPSQADRQFVEKASQGGVAEVELGKLAQQKGMNPAVQEFGRHMMMDHQKANDDLRSIASRVGLSAATAMNPADKALYNRLSGMSGAQFDQTYIREMIGDHQADIAEFQKEAASGSDPTIKAFASDGLPTLRQHLQMAQDASAQLKSAAGQ